MAEVLDLFGDPVPEGWGKRGRPQHIPTQRNRNKVIMLVALGWGNARIAAALYVTPPTLNRHYFRELKQREVARDRMTAEHVMLLWAQCEAGNVGALKEFRKLVEANDLMLYGQTSPLKPKEEQKKLGKKEAALVAAHQPNTETTLGDLMAQRQQTGRPN